MKLIDKDAVVAEMERLKNTSLEYGYNTMQRVLADSGKDLSLEQLRYFLDTLEVKEVDLEKEIYNFWDKNYRKVECGVKDIKLIGEHFFELGLKAQKGK